MLRKNNFVLVLALVLASTFVVADVLEAPTENLKADWINNDIEKSAGLEGINIPTFDSKVGDYGKVSLKTLFGAKQILDLELKENSDVCGEECFAIKHFQLKQNTSLVDDFRTYLNDSGDWVLSPIRNHQFFINTSGMTMDIDIYKWNLTEVLGNGTEVGEWIFNGTVEQDMPDWSVYEEGKVLPAGNYTLKLVGYKKPSWTYDWQILSNGVWVTEYAVWGNISGGDDAEILLQTPADNEVDLDGLVNHTCFFNITGGAVIENTSLVTNESGVWSIKNTTITSLNSDGLTSFFFFDEASGSVIDNFGGKNGTNSGCTRNVTGLINKSFDFESTDPDFVALDNTILPTGASANFSISIWIKPESVTGAEQGIFNQNSAGAGRLILNLNASNHVRMFIGGTSITDPSQVLLNVWTHVVATRQGTNVSLFVNNTFVNSFSKGDGIDNTNAEIGRVSGAGNYFDGQIDEASFFNVSISDSTRDSLYNFGFSNRLKPLSINQSWVRKYNETTLWSCAVGDSDGANAFDDENRTSLLDATFPSVTINSPLNNTFILNNSDNVTLNFSAVDVNLDSCWYNYNGTNTTISGCLNATTNQTNITTVFPFNQIIVYANDSVGNENSTNITFLFDYPNITINSPSASVSANNVTFNFSIDAVGILDTCSYNVTTSGLGVVVADNTINCSNLVEFQTISDGVGYILTAWANTTGGISNQTSFTFDVGSAGAVGSAISGGTVEEREELIAEGICDAFPTSLREAWGDFVNNTSVETFVGLWRAFWDRGLCDSAGSIVPREYFYT